MKKTFVLRWIIMNSEALLLNRREGFHAMNQHHLGKPFLILPFQPLRPMYFGFSYVYKLQYLFFHSLPLSFYQMNVCGKPCRTNHWFMQNQMLMEAWMRILHQLLLMMLQRIVVFPCDVLT